jgi:hypothetical protein
MGAMKDFFALGGRNATMEGAEKASEKSPKHISVMSDAQNNLPVPVLAESKDEARVSTQYHRSVERETTAGNARGGQSIFSGWRCGVRGDPVTESFFHGFYVH